MRMLDVAGGNMLSDEYAVFQRAAFIVCLVRCNAAAASDVQSPWVIDGMGCVGMEFVVAF